MSQTHDLVARYFDTWNQPDTGRRTEMAESVWAPDGVYVDPMSRTEGGAEFSAMVGDLRSQNSELTVRLAGDIEEHHEVLRFRWEVASGNGAVEFAGDDIAVLAGDGRFAQVIGFMDSH